MSAADLMPGDRVSFVQNGRKLRGVVVEALFSGKLELVPVQRPSERKPSCRLDHPDRPIREPKTRWIKRSELRKLPVKNEPK
jgi:hypothetical protein